MVTAEVSSRTTAACSDCAWTSDPLTNDLSVRVAARQHTDLTQHPVVVFTSTITVLEPTRTVRSPTARHDRGGRRRGWCW